MEILEFVAKAENGKVIIKVPEHLEGKQVKVIVMLLDDWNKLSETERQKILPKLKLNN